MFSPTFGSSKCLHMLLKYLPIFYADSCNKCYSVHVYYIYIYYVYILLYIIYICIVAVIGMCIKVMLVLKMGVAKYSSVSHPQ